MHKLLIQDTTIIDLPARCVGQNINRARTYIIDLGKVPTIISARDSDLVGKEYFRQHVRKRKFATQIKEMTLRDSQENELR